MAKRDFCEWCGCHDSIHARGCEQALRTTVLRLKRRLKRVEANLEDVEARFRQSIDQFTHDTFVREMFDIAKQHGFPEGAEDPVLLAAWIDTQLHPPPAPRVTT